MPGVQCVICLSADTSSEEWCVLKECGHVFHTHCVLQSLEHSKRCPQCRADCKKYNARNPAFLRIFFEFSDEPASQPPPPALGGAGGGGSSGPGGGCGGVDLQQVAFLQGQLRDKDRRIQAVSTQLVEAEEKLQRTERELELARSALRDKDARLQEKIQELAREHKAVKGLANQVANLTTQLKQEAQRASLWTLASDHTLVGPALAAELERLAALGLRAPNDFWEKLLGERNQLIMSNSNKHSRERAAMEARQQQLQAEVAKLQEEVATLKHRLAAAAAAQHQQLRGAPSDSVSLRLELLARDHSSAVSLGGSSRHPHRRFASTGGGASGAGPAAAAATAASDEDPLVRSYDLLSMRIGDLPGAASVRPPQLQPPPAAQRPHHHQQQQQQQQRHTAALLPTAAVQQHQHHQQQQAHHQQAGEEEEEEEEEGDEEIVLLDGSEDQEQGEELQLVRQGGGAEAEAEAEGDEAGCYSEIESDGEEAEQQQEEWRQQHAAAMPASAAAGATAALQQQGQQEQRQGAGSLLGKRPAAQPGVGAAGVSKQQQRRHSQGAGRNTAGSGQAGWTTEEENCAGGGNSRSGAALLAAAGPGRTALRHAPGKTFLRNALAASVGIDRGKYISSGPDGKGGVATAYQGGGDAGPVRMAQKQLDMRAVQQPGGANKKARPSGSSSSSSRVDAAALRTNNLPITSFFSRKQQ